MKKANKKDKVIYPDFSLKRKFMEDMMTENRYILFELSVLELKYKVTVILYIMTIVVLLLVLGGKC